MRKRTAMLLLCTTGMLSVFVSLEHLGLVHQSPLGALGIYTIGILAFVFGARGVVRN
jgi:hypothetical protein